MVPLLSLGYRNRSRCKTQSAFTHSSLTYIQAHHSKKWQRDEFPRFFHPDFGWRSPLLCLPYLFGPVPRSCLSCRWAVLASAGFLQPMRYRHCRRRPSSQAIGLEKKGEGEGSFALRHLSCSV